MNQYALFLEKCKNYKIKCEVSLKRFDELRDRFEYFPVDNLLDWLWAKGKRKITTLRIINWMKKEKDFARQRQEKKEELNKIEISQNEAKRQVNMKKREERAREKARISEFEEPECRQVNQKVLNWKQQNPERYEKGIEHFLKLLLKEHSGLAFFGKDRAKLIAKARLNNFLEKKLM